MDTQIEQTCTQEAMIEAARIAAIRQEPDQNETQIQTPIVEVEAPQMTIKRGTTETEG